MNVMMVSASIRQYKVLGDERRGSLREWVGRAGDVSTSFSEIL